jgi:hypothetical protein
MLCASGDLHTHSRGQAGDNAALCAQSHKFWNAARCTRSCSTKIRTEKALMPSTMSEEKSWQF